MFDIRNVLAISQIYQAFQRGGGFFGARLKALNRYMPIGKNDRVVDVGCGPGYLLDHLPPFVSYFGFDTDKRYIEHARKRAFANAEFMVGYFDETAAERLAPVDVVLMTGLLHHLTDQEARTLLEHATKTLRVGGRILTLDGCYLDGQSVLERKLLQWDRGRHVRTEAGYRALFPANCVSLDVFVDRDISRIPYTFITIVATKLR